MNSVTLMGRLTKDPELREFDNGKSVTNFSIATDESYKKDGKRIEASEFHNIVAYSPLSEILSKYFKKGQRILVTGKLRTRSWESNTGDKKYSTEILVNQFEFIEKASNSNSSQTQPAQSSFQDEEDDLPF